MDLYIFIISNQLLEHARLRYVCCSFCIIRSQLQRMFVGLSVDQVPRKLSTLHIPVTALTLTDHQIKSNPVTRKLQRGEYN